MIIVKLGRKERERAFALLIAGETTGRVYTTFPIPKHTRKQRRSKLYRVTRGSV